jgi:hypothetical protein
MEDAGAAPGRGREVAAEPEGHRGDPQPRTGRGPLCLVEDLLGHFVVRGRRADAGHGAGHCQGHAADVLRGSHLHESSAGDLSGIVVRPDAGLLFDHSAQTRLDVGDVGAAVGCEAKRCRSERCEQLWASAIIHRRTHAHNRRRLLTRPGQRLGELPLLLPTMACGSKTIGNRADAPPRGGDEHQELHGLRRVLRSGDNAPDVSSSAHGSPFRQDVVSASEFGRRRSWNRTR